MAPRIPVDIWLLVFDALDDQLFLWTTCRNISHSVRACVDSYLRYGLRKNWLIDLYYSDFHTRKGLIAHNLHLPMVFDRFSDDGTRAFFQQRAYREITFIDPLIALTATELKSADRSIERRHQGSVRGWVPFIERYCDETLKPRPGVLSKSKPSEGAPLWEQMHDHRKKTLSGKMREAYLVQLRIAVSIGRGDHPPYHLRIGDYINDTELVDLEVDCKQREISFAWRETYALFCREQAFVVRAQNTTVDEKRAHDVDILACEHKYAYGPVMGRDDRRARRKRLAPWVRKNKHRMSPKTRWCTERDIDFQTRFIRQLLRHGNLCEVDEAARDEPEEIVPARLADDHPDLMRWPSDTDNRSLAPWSRGRCIPAKCVIM
jgi:hypothetical protein